MVFSSQLFLYAFLPAVLLAYVLAGRNLRNTVLLGFSLLFYAWGEQQFVVLMLFSITANHFLGRMIAAGSERTRRWALVGGVGLNLLLLGVFKYAAWFVGSLNWVLATLHGPQFSVPDVHLPIGISFFTFQAISYIVDVYRGDAEAQPRVRSTALYISLFPQLIAGPIVRYRQIAEALAERAVTLHASANGVRRFTIGLAKKVLVANTLAVPADHVFSLPAEQISPGLAWVGVICYTLQIYYDFSGYSDMAIGLGRFFGFVFPENFQHPYHSRSIREFWRRWHISLSSWFRDYLFIPLGGSRGSTLQTYRNLLLVFFLCGLWHGASWTFVLWGLFHGLFLVLERGPFGRLVDSAWSPIRRIYVVLVVAIGWVLFRAETLTVATAVLGAMGGVPAAVAPATAVASLLQPDVAVALVAGIYLASPRRWISRAIDPSIDRGWWMTALECVVFATAWFACSMQLASGSHNPFLYFRF